jgi:hypothetical protein
MEIPYSVIGAEGRAEWHKSIIKAGWDLYDAAVDLVYSNNLRNGQHIPAQDAICSAAKMIEDGKPLQAEVWLNTALVVSADEIQKQQVRDLLKKIKGE